MRCSRATRIRAEMRSSKPFPATSAGVPAMHRSWKQSRLAPNECAASIDRCCPPEFAEMDAAKPFRYISSDRRVREDRRFVAGKGRFAADIALPGMCHVALVTSPYPAARILSIDKSQALATRGVHCVLDGRELAGATLPLLAGLDTPKVPRRPLALEVARYAGEWVAAVVADSRALAEDAAELVQVDYEPLPFVLDGEEAFKAGSPLVHAEYGSNILLDRTFIWGEVERDFAQSAYRLP